MQVARELASYFIKLQFAFSPSVFLLKLCWGDWHWQSAHAIPHEDLPASL